MVFYTQSTITVISGRTDRQTDRLYVLILKFYDRQTDRQLICTDIKVLRQTDRQTDRQIICTDIQVLRKKYNRCTICHYCEWQIVKERPHVLFFLSHQWQIALQQRHFRFIFDTCCCCFFPPFFAQFFSFVLVTMSSKQNKMFFHCKSLFNYRGFAVCKFLLGLKAVWLETCLFYPLYVFIHFCCCIFCIIVQQLCESRGGPPGLSVLTTLLVSVDVKLYWTMLRHWSQLVPNMSTNIWGH